VCVNGQYLQAFLQKADPQMQLVSTKSVESTDDQKKKLSLYMATAGKSTLRLFAKIFFVAALFLVFSVSVVGKPWSKGKLYLTVRIQDPFVQDVTIRQRVFVDRLLTITKQIGAVKLTITAIVHPQENGTWPITLAVSEYVSKTENEQDTCRLNLRTDKSFGIGAVSSLIYERTLTLTSR